MSSTDSSSDEDNLDLLREAADIQFMKDAFLKSVETSISRDSNKNESTSMEKRPSLRPRMDEVLHYTPLIITPKLQNLIANGLGKKIEEQLIEFKDDMPPIGCNECNGSVGGIRLFGSSSNYISCETLPVKKVKKRKIYIPQEDETKDDSDNYRSVAVTAEWITSGTAVCGWQKSKRGEVLVVDGKGNIIEHTGVKTKIKCNRWGIRDIELYVDLNPRDGNHEERKKVKVDSQPRDEIHKERRKVEIDLQPKYESREERKMVKYRKQREKRKLQKQYEKEKLQKLTTNGDVLNST